MVVGCELLSCLAAFLFPIECVIYHYFFFSWAAIKSLLSDNVRVKNGYLANESALLLHNSLQGPCMLISSAKQKRVELICHE